MAHFTSRECVGLRDEVAVTPVKGLGYALVPIPRALYLLYTKVVDLLFEC